MPNLDGMIQLIHDFVEHDETRHFLVFTPDYTFKLNRANGQFEALNLIPFLGGDSIRWQAAAMNNRLYAVNGADPVQEFTPPSTIIPLAETPVDYLTTLPDSARYILNSLNHLVLAFTTESGIDYVNRVRWSEIDDPSIWVPDSSINEAGYLDVGAGGEPIYGITQGSTNQIRVFKRNSLHTLTYYGLPLIYVPDQVVVNEGMIAPYAIASVNNTDFFIGQRDFYMWSGPRPTPIGTTRIRDTFYNDVNLGSDMSVFGFVHHLYPEVWFVYKSKDSDVFNKCLTYNWELEIWASRDYFPMSALGIYLDQNVQTIDDLVWTWEDPETLLTWAEKRSGGVPLLIGGDESGELYLHGGVEDADGVQLVGTLKTGHIRVPSRNVQTRIGRVSLDNKGDLNVRLGCKNNPGGSITFGDSQTVGVDGLFDEIAVAREFQLEITATKLVSLGELSLWWKDAGHRP